MNLQTGSKKIALVMACLLFLSVTANIIFINSQRTWNKERQELQEKLEFYKDYDTKKDDLQNLPSLNMTDDDKKILNEKIGELKETVSSIRGLEWKQDIEVLFLDRSDLRQKILEANEDEINQEELDIIDSQLTIWDLIPPDYNYYEEQINLLEEQIAGFYDPQTKELYLIGSSDISLMDEVVIVHELTHALQDQYFDLASLQGANEENDDSYLALIAVIEGDASLVMSQYIQEYFDPEDQLKLAKEAMSVDQSILKNTPKFITESLSFPYEGGLDFVEEAYKIEGWSLVNNLFYQLPTSTEQILHPEKYILDKENPEVLTGYDERLSLEDNWQLIDNGIMGEFGWLTIFQEKFKKKNSREASTGWAGDFYQFYQNQEEHLFYSKTAWDTTADADEFLAQMNEYLSQIDEKTIDDYQIIQKENIVEFWLSTIQITNQNIWQTK